MTDHIIIAVIVFIVFVVVTEYIIRLKNRIRFLHNIVGAYVFKYGELDIVELIRIMTGEK